MFEGGFLPEDRYARFEVWCLDVRDESPFEARAQAVFKCLDLARMAVALQDDVFVCIVQRVERMKEFFLRVLLFGEELDIVDEQDVDVAVFLAERFGIAVSDGIDEFIRKFFARNVKDAHLGEFFQDLVPDGVHEMRLSKAYAAIHEEGVVDSSGRFGDGERGCMSEAVGIARDECIEGVVRVQGGSVAGSDHAGRFIGAAVVFFFGLCGR